MLLAAGVSAGFGLERVNAALRRMGLPLELGSEIVPRGGARATRIVALGPDGAKAPLGAGGGAGEPSHPHAPRAGKGNHGRHASGPPRTLRDVLRLVDAAGLSPAATARARAVFQALAEAEARAHGESADRVHFHEVGQDDAVADIVGAALLWEDLGIERLVCSRLNVGAGHVECAHGRFPVPAPATLELLRGLPVYSDGVEAELVTPTGAALVRALAQGFGPMPPLRPEVYGHGAGSYDLPGRADVLRLIVGRAVEPAPRAGGGDAGDVGVTEGAGGSIAVLACNVDDMSPQIYGYLADRALALGALDIFSQPAQMKKNRPGLLITVLARPERAATLTRLLLEETTTLGVRRSDARRTELERRVVAVETPYGAIRLKLGESEGRMVNIAPEYEDCRAAAERHQIPLKRVIQAALRAGEERG